MAFADSLYSIQSQKERATCYVPCRIRFSLLAQLNPRNAWAGSVAKSKINKPVGGGSAGAVMNQVSSVCLSIMDVACAI